MPLASRIDSFFDIVTLKIIDKYTSRYTKARLGICSSLLNI